jgi:predicted Fe-Mo cluster-binding NifX family protein
MKIAFSATGSTPEASLDGRFGRAPKFILIDLESGVLEVIDNTASRNAAQGAGIQAAEAVAARGAGAVVTGHCGPKAFRVLAAAGIQVYRCEEATVARALEAYRAGRLVPARSSDAGGHGRRWNEA